MIRHQTGYWIHEGNLAKLDVDVINEVVTGNCYRMNLVPPGLVFVDVGAHIGCASMLYHQQCPQSKIICVEACPENIPILKANVGHFATVIQAACTYEKNARLLNSFTDNPTATGGSRVVNSSEKATGFNHQVRDDDRPLKIVTLEEIAKEHGQIEIVKLDCEGSEFSILRNSPQCWKAKYMFGEYHDQVQWDALRSDLYRNWTYQNPHRAGGLGTFSLMNPVAHCWDVVVGQVRDRHTKRIVFDR